MRVLYFIFLHTEPIFEQFCNCVDHNNSQAWSAHPSTLFHHYFSQNKPKYFPHILSRILFPVCVPGPPPATHSDPDPRIVWVWCHGAITGTWGGTQESEGNKACLLSSQESGGEWSGVLGKVDIEDNMWVIESEWAQLRQSVQYLLF